MSEKSENNAENKNNGANEVGNKTDKNEIFEKYDLTVGLEIHAELKTKTKMFCACVNNPDEKEPNVNTCPICLGHPGTLPVPNKEAVKSMIKIGLAVGGKIADFTEFDRKNYFYPDIPKGYQISQYKYPIVSGGNLAGVELTRIHLEEDTGTSQHDKGDFSLLNYNRAGAPLMELVTEPVIHSAQKAGEFATELQLLLRTLGVAEANMEKGEMRVEANISVALKGAEKLGTKVEVKNLNSFKSAERAIDYEMKRMIELLEKGRGDEIVQETRGFDENAGKTFSQRKKENSNDYRYFPEPDIPKFYLSQIAEFAPEILRTELPELPWEKRARYAADFGIKIEDIEIFVREKVWGDFFENVIKDLGGDKNKIALASNFIVSDLIGLSKKEKISGEDLVAKISHKSFAELISLFADKKISSRGAKDILQIIYKEGNDGSTKTSPTQIAETKGFLISNDPEALKKVVAEIVANNLSVVAEYKTGKTNLIQFLVGQGMKAMKGAGDPATIKEELEKVLV
jgi:aspartyl-tRNA(Asn)/glutamyl-tRNA(Gln) amidotransferase subunit B